MKFKLSNLASMLGTPSGSSQQEMATLLFADICGSTHLFEKYGDVRARQIESRVLDLLAARTATHHGTVIKTIGDEIMSRFPAATSGVQAACDMQEGIKNDPVLVDLNIAIRIGLHHGSVLVEKNDVFGDAVNVAARMVALAKADQIITTRETVSYLSPDLQQMTRGLGRSWVRGKQDEMEIVEVIWYESTSLTQMSDVETQKILRNKLYARLLLVYRGQNIELAPSAEPFSIGRGTRNNLVIDRELVSRSHAIIESRQGKFILADHSTNGTYLMLENGSRFFVRREEIILQDQGIICLGQAAFDENPDVIHYECKYAA
ncbi:MAG TPA: adenylate/guanylate cyclase domain-containing protein [Candidatus Competibacteraceae bacterium]|nr:adenylate/guanylate cyclase domain-containing protein [Candidatus Competibacteraceae bacterium]